MFGIDGVMYLMGIIYYGICLFEKFTSNKK